MPRRCSPFDREFHNVFRVKVGGVFSEAGPGGVLDPLIHWKDGNIAGAGKASGIVDPLQMILDALVPVCNG